MSGSISLDSDCVYSFVLNLDASDNPVVTIYEACPGDCSTAKPLSAGASLESFYADAPELLMEIPVEGEGYSRAQ